MFLLCTYRGMIAHEYPVRTHTTHSLAPAVIRTQYLLAPHICNGPSILDHLYEASVGSSCYATIGNERQVKAFLLPQLKTGKDESACVSHVTWYMNQVILKMIANYQLHTRQWSHDLDFLFDREVSQSAHKVVSDQQ